MPAATYEFNTTLYQDLGKAARDLVAFLDHLPTFGLNATRFDVDGRRVTNGTIRFVTNAALPPHYLVGIDVFPVNGSPNAYEFTTALLANVQKAADDMLVFFDHIAQGYVLLSISIDGRTLTNGVVQVTLNDVAPASMIFGMDVMRVA